MNTTRNTLARALAYVAITGNKRGLHFNTRCSIGLYTKLGDVMAAGPLYTVTEEGMVLAKTADMWKAHEALLAAGFKLDTRRKHKPGFISYFAPEPVETKYGKSYTRCGFISQKGTPYADMPSATSGSGWDMQKLTARESDS